MSQKPRAGVPARAAAAGKSAPKEAAGVKVDPVTPDPDVEVDPVVAKTIVAAPADTVPVIAEAVEAAASDAAPVVAETVEAEPAEAVSFAPDAGVPEFATLSSPSHETVLAVSDLAAASARAVSTTITATADTVAAVTAEVVETASSIEPKQPTITRGIKTMMKTTEDFVAFGQANLEAFVKS